MTVMTDTLTPDELERLIAATPLTDWVGRANLIPQLAARATLWIARNHHQRRGYKVGVADDLPKGAIQVFTGPDAAQAWGGPDHVPEAVSLVQVCEMVVRMDLGGAMIDGRHGEHFNIGPNEALYIHHGLWPAPLVPGESVVNPVLPAQWKATIQAAGANWQWVAAKALEMVPHQPEIKAGYLTTVSLNGRPPIHVVFLDQADGVPIDVWRAAADRVALHIGKWPVMDKMVRLILVWGIITGMRDAVVKSTRPFYVAPPKPEGPAPQ